MKLLSTIVPAAIVLAILTGQSAESKPVQIYGNAYGLWSPTHPHLTGGKTKRHSPVLYVPPPPPPMPEVELSSEISEVPDICPTLQSAPHLCQTL
jgi:hypothetical protein